MEALCKEGRFSKEVIVDRLPEMASAINDGMTWLIVRWQVGEACPNLAMVVQEAMNLQHQTARVQTKVQMLLQFHARAMMNSSAGSAVDWKAIGEAIGRSKPHLGTQIMDMSNFCEKWSGGTNPVFLKELEEFS